MPSPERVKTEYDRVFKSLITMPFNRCQPCGEHLSKFLPMNPGHYAFKLEEGEIVYVGKASNLRTRLTYSHSVFRRVWLDRIDPDAVRVTWVPTPVRYIPCMRWIEKRILFTLRGCFKSVERHYAAVPSRPEIDLRVGECAQRLPLKHPLKPRYNEEIPKKFDEATAMQQLQKTSGDLQEVLKFLPPHLRDSLKDYADSIGISDQVVVELAFSMFFDLGATSFGEIEKMPSLGMMREEIRTLSDENRQLREEVERLRQQNSNSSELS
jgi:hypothetical protein